MLALQNFLRPAIAAAVLAVAPIAATAATITGSIDISGSVNLGSSDFSTTGSADLNDPGFVVLSSGDFSSIGAGTSVTLIDIDFTSPGDIWEVAGFTFTASGFTNFVDTAIKSFTAIGSVSGNGFDQTSGVLSFTSQGSTGNVSFSSTTAVPLPAAGFLLFGALGGIGFVGRRRRKAA